MFADLLHEEIQGPDSIRSTFPSHSTTQLMKIVMSRCPGIPSAPASQLPGEAYSLEADLREHLNQTDTVL
ncbi:hypothetical protein D3C77_459700 [compost metagenome]